MMRVGFVRGCSLALTLAGLFTSSCASDSAAQKSAGDVVVAGAQRIDDETFKPDDYQRRDLDLNKDGKPDG